MGEALVVDIEKWIVDEIVTGMGPASAYNDELTLQTVVATILRNAADWEKATLPAAYIEVARVDRNIRSHGNGRLNFEKTYPITILLVTDGDMITAPQRVKTLEARLEALVRTWTSYDLMDSRGEILNRLLVGSSVWESIHAPSSVMPNRRYGVSATALTMISTMAG